MSSSKSSINLSKQLSENLIPTNPPNSRMAASMNTFKILARDILSYVSRARSVTKTPPSQIQTTKLRFTKLRSNKTFPLCNGVLSYFSCIMGSRARNWCFTLNNYTDDDLIRINALVDTNNKVTYVLYGKEVAESGTPHLQGFISCKDQLRLQQIKIIIGSNPHLEVARNVNASIIYCKKEGDWIEFGARNNSNAGKRNDLEEFKNAVKEGMLNMKDIREAHADVYAKYPRFCLEYVRDNFPKPIIPDHPLRPWQQHLHDLLEEEPNRRTIIFIVDEIGNSGKSWFADWYQQKTGDTCQVLTPGKRADMAYMLPMCLRVLFLDAPRAKQSEFIQYDFLEDLKNGRVFSPKYESIMKTYEPMHIVVCMNEEPDRTKLSADRYKVINIRQLHVE